MIRGLSLGAVALAALSFAPAASAANGSDSPSTSAGAAAARRALPQLPKGYQYPIPRQAEHTEFIVETNKKGQVVKVDAGKQCKNRTFNAFTYGNALQTFIRTPDGHAIAGYYKLTYDYDPKTLNVRRDVELVKAGGVNPNAEGAVDEMADIVRRHAEGAAADKARSATPLPDIRDITGHK